MRIALFLLLVINLQATATIVLEATQQGLFINGNLHHLQISKDFNKVCKTKFLDGRWAIKAKCLQTLDTLNINGDLGHGISLHFWRQKDDQDAEYVLAYSSDIAKSTALKIFRIINRPKEAWLQQNLYLPGLLFRDNRASLTFKNTDKSIHQYQKSVTELDSLGASNFIDPTRFKLKPFTSIQNIQQHGLFSNNKLWINRIVLFTDSLENQEKIVTNFLKNIQNQYLPFLQKKENHSILILILLAILGTSLWAVTRYLQIQLMSSLIMPTTLIVILMTKPMIEYFNSLEEIRLQKIEQEVRTVFTNIKQARKIAMKNIHRKLTQEKYLLKQALDATNFVNHPPYIVTPQKIDQLTNKELKKRIKRLQKKRIHKLYDISEKDNFLKARLSNCKQMIEEFSYETLNQQQLRELYSKLVYQNSIVPFTLAKLEVKTGLGLKLSNGRVVIEASRINSGFHNQRGLEGPLMIQLLHNLKKTPDQISKLNREHRQAVLLFRKQLSELEIKPQFITKYMNEPHNWHEIVTSRKTDTFTMNSWQLIDARNGPWVLLMNLNLSSLTREMAALIKDNQLNKLVSKNKISKTTLDYFNSNQRPEPSFEYLFLGEKNRETFPIHKENSYLSRAANLSKIYQTPVFLPSIINNRSYVAMGFPLPDNPAYVISIGREVTNDWIFLRDLKTRIQWLILFLILSPLLLAAKIAGKITEPLRQLGKAVFEIAKGRYSTQLKLSGLDEFSRLASEFNRMSVSLQKGEELTSFISNESLQNILQKKNVSNREEVSILFCGLHNFDDYHKIDSDSARQFFEKFIINCQIHIQANGGSVDKFTGIAILAIFRNQNKEIRAVSAAQKIKFTLEKINKTSIIPFHVGIGLATGPVILGQVGANKRKDFTCIGNTVNLAARLESLSLKSHAEITIYLDYETLSKVPEDEVSTQELQPTKIKGKQELQKVYELV